MNGDKGAYAHGHLPGMRELFAAAETIEKLKQDKQKLIEGLRHYADRRNHPPFWLYEDGEKARSILKEIGETI